MVFLASRVAMQRRLVAVSLDFTGTLARVRGGSVGQVYVRLASQCWSAGSCVVRQADALRAAGVEGADTVTAASMNAAFRQAWKDHWRRMPNFGHSQMSEREWWGQVRVECADVCSPIDDWMM
jgi:hypothetical protein